MKKIVVLLLVVLLVVVDVYLFAEVSSLKARVGVLEKRNDDVYSFLDIWMRARDEEYWADKPARWESDDSMFVEIYCNSIMQALNGILNNGLYNLTEDEVREIKYRSGIR